MYIPNIIVVIVTGHGHIDCGFVDACCLGQFTVLFQIPGFICRVFVYNIHLFILEITLSHQYDITGCDPHLFSHLSTNVTQASYTIKAKALTATVAQHLYDLRIFLACKKDDNQVVS